MMYTNRKEQGVVSLLTVIFFMIFISLIVVGFTTIVVTDHRQTIDNDLAASALAAARSGIEDGKRILLYCHTHPGDLGCAAVLDNTDCDALGSGEGSTLASTLGISINSSTGEGATGGATAYQQYFTCLTIQTKTDTVQAPLNSGSDYIQHLATVSPFTTLTVKWESDETGFFNRTSTINGWPTLTAWNDSHHYLPVIQFQVIPYVTSSFSNLDDLEHGTRTVYLVPCSGSSCVSVAPNIGVDGRVAVGNTRPTDSPPILYANCTTVGSSCSITLSGFSGGNPGGTQYYVRASILYASEAKLTLSATDGSGGAVLFDNVQPQIDVTGRTNDVFKRVQAQVSYSSDIYTPTSALDSAAPICKDMIVTNNAATSQYNCN